MEQQRLQYLLEQYVNDKATAAEIQELEQYDLQSEENLALLADLMADGFAQQPAETEWAEEARFSGLAQKALQIDKGHASLRPAARPVHRVHFLRRWGWAAAAALLIAGTVIYYYNKPAGKNMLAAKAPVKTDIGPGQQGAILTLADNTQVLLDTIKNGVVALQGGAIARVVNGTLHYEGTGTNQVFNTMYTPKGRQYHLTLPDGTQVWLNAASSIRYPTVFNQQERRVTVTGEAYLEIAPDAKKPFYVETPHTQILALGTAFNINAYADERSEITTLTAGKVRVSGIAQANGSQPSVTLLPGQAASCSGQTITRQEGDVEKALAWKNGLFSFSEADIPTVMRQLARWYNVEIKYEGQIPTRAFTGEIGKTLTLDQVLRILTKIRIHYEIEGHTLTIKP